MIFNEIVSLVELNLRAFIIRIAIIFYLYKIKCFQTIDVEIGVLHFLFI
jgi:hypothetical protein